MIIASETPSSFYIFDLSNYLHLSDKTNGSFYILSKNDLNHINKFFTDYGIEIDLCKTELDPVFKKLSFKNDIELGYFKMILTTKFKVQETLTSFGFIERSYYLGQ